jgi:dGTPase
LEDAIGAGFIGLQDLGRVALWQEAYTNAIGQQDVEHIHAIRRLLLDTLLDTVLDDVTTTSRDPLASTRSPKQVRQAGRGLVALSREMETQLGELERFLTERVYKHSDVAAADAKGRRMILALFETYREKPDTLPGRFARRVAEQGPERVICDYIAGMTDRFCIREYNRHVLSHTRRM